MKLQVFSSESAVQEGMKVLPVKGGKPSPDEILLKGLKKAKVSPLKALGTLTKAQAKKITHPGAKKVQSHLDLLEQDVLKLHKMSKKVIKASLKVGYKMPKLVEKFAALKVSELNKAQFIIKAKFPKATKESKAIVNPFIRLHTAIVRRDAMVAKASQAYLTWYDKQLTKEKTKAVKLKEKAKAPGKKVKVSKKVEEVKAKPVKKVEPLVLATVSKKLFGAKGKVEGKKSTLEISIKDKQKHVDAKAINKALELGFTKVQTKDLFSQQFEMQNLQLVVGDNLIELTDTSK